MRTNSGTCTQPSNSASPMFLHIDSPANFQQVYVFLCHIATPNIRACYMFNHRAPWLDSLLCCDNKSVLIHKGVFHSFGRINCVLKPQFCQNMICEWVNCSHENTNPCHMIFAIFYSRISTIKLWWSRVHCCEFFMSSHRFLVVC